MPELIFVEALEGPAGNNPSGISHRARDRSSGLNDNAKCFKEFFAGIAIGLIRFTREPGGRIRRVFFCSYVPAMWDTIFITL